MKNYGLQVKEIPIIFRGTIDGATPGGTGTLFYSGTVSKTSVAPDNVYQCDIEDHVRITEDIETLFITWDGVKYNNLPVEIQHIDAGGEELIIGSCGAPYDPNTGSFDDSNYPFRVEYVINDPYGQALQIYYLIDTTHEIVVESPGGESVNTKIIFSADLTGNGQINHFRARFACGENGTLHLRPYVILNGNIRVNLCNFAQGGDQYIAGDNEEIEFDCYVPIETHATAYVEAENTGEYPSLVDAAMTVQYEDFIESESIVGYEGVNLRRGRR